jgi:histidine ammonia-lyase
MNTPAASIENFSEYDFAFGEDRLTIEHLYALATGSARGIVSDGARKNMQRTADTVAKLHEEGAAVYGITTSVGASVDTPVPPERSAEFSLNLLRMHGVGTGRKLSSLESAAVLATRISSLAIGKSGVRPVIVERLAELLEHRALPVIPSEGSVGASGDLTPLSYVAAVLAGEREVMYGGEERDASAVLEEIGLEPLELGPKEALSLMNGTSVATAIGALGWLSARRLARLSCALTAMVTQAIDGNPTHFDAYVHDARPHPGQRLSASWIREDLAYDPQANHEPHRLQERYSIRCAPHIVGVLIDALSWSQNWLEIELNGASDNPVIDPDRGIPVHGGNFYGGHVGFAFDSLKTAVANVACLMDRQLMVLCNKAENGGLPPNLVGVEGDEACTHNGFKAVTIATSALAAEALKLTTPASSFSRSTELHNQDKVPMATTAARDLLRIVELTESVASMLTIACCQAVDLRGTDRFATRGRTIHRQVREHVPRLREDRRMDAEIEMVSNLIRRDALAIGSQDLEYDDGQ